MNSWRDKRVLCTGATGIVGSWVSEMLLDGDAQVIALARDTDHRSHFYRSGTYKRAAVINGSVEDFGTVERAINEYEIDTVIHLAAQPIVQTARRYPLQTFETN